MHLSQYPIWVRILSTGDYIKKVSLSTSTETLFLFEKRFCLDGWALVAVEAVTVQWAETNLTRQCFSSVFCPVLVSLDFSVAICFKGGYVFRDGFLQTFVCNKWLFSNQTAHFPLISDINKDFCHRYFFVTTSVHCSGYWAQVKLFGSGFGQYRHYVHVVVGTMPSLQMDGGCRLSLCRNFRGKWTSSPRTAFSSSSASGSVSLRGFWLLYFGSSCVLWTASQGRHLKTCNRSKTIQQRSGEKNKKEKSEKNQQQWWQKCAIC